MVVFFFLCWGMKITVCLNEEAGFISAMEKEEKNYEHMLSCWDMPSWSMINETEFMTVL